MPPVAIAPVWRDPLRSTIVATSRPARGEIPIAVKLIATTSILIAVGVGTATFFSQRALAEISESQIAARRHSGEKAIARDAELVTQAVATAVAFPLATGGEITPLLETAVENDRKAGDNRFLWLLARKPQGEVAARTSRTPDPPTLAAYEHMLRSGASNNGVIWTEVGDHTWVYSADIRLDGSSFGTLWLGVSFAKLEGELAAAIEEAEAAARGARNRALLIALIVLALGMALAALHGIQLARPIQELTAQVERIAAGHLDSQVKEVRRDEIGVLAQSFNAMSAEVRRLMTEQARKASLEKEMSLARQVQQAMLPPHSLDQHGALRVVGYCMPASTCGGDWWTYRKLSHGRMLIVVGDATGHGIHSAMIAATARGAVEALSTLDERVLTPEAVLRAIDAAIRQLGDPSVLMTAFAAVLDPTFGVLHYANAGQNFPYVLRTSAAHVLEEPRIVAASGNPLGDHKIPVDIRRGSLALHPGDLFVCFTDGLVERANPDGQLFGDRRLRSALIGEQIFDGAALLTLRDRVVEKVEAYADGAIAEDDITLVMCQFDPALAQLPTELGGRGAA